MSAAHAITVVKRRH